MGENTGQLWLGWKILLCIHLVAYLGFFIAALSTFNQIWYASQNNFIILLGWTVLLLAHVGTHFYYAGRAQVGALERQAYRDGFADAVRQLSRTSQGIERLTLEDDEDYFELPEKRKR